MERYLNTIFLCSNDDKNFFPVYNLCPTVRKEVLDKHPEIADIFRPVMSVLDDATMQQLNYEVDVEGKPARMVAELFLKERGFIE
jgi:osmoprotectant transport system substrate-binding protein